MKGIILAGGTGSRLYPLTQMTNKHLLPVGKYPMIYHAVYKLLGAGIQEILIVSGRHHMGSIVHLLGSGHEIGASFTYKAQDKAGGVAQALGLARTFAGGDLVTVILGDNIFSDELLPHVNAFKQRGGGAHVLVKEVEHPEAFGVAEIVGGRIAAIEEKPRHPKSALAVTGIYMYDSRVFDIVKCLKPSARGELEITDVNNKYIAWGELTHEVLQGWWTDAGTHETLALANELSMNVSYEPKSGIKEVVF
ncbi:sugar phosphate nucleotidyltransferase [Paenibacillus piri]|uniref:Glucose-1-phosphate thymidylyltransferase n=1 Tax=Paenibacillus piri TaxID=2547395 RepID=A0A4R5KXL5_9BACL|nr:sugar phosphate nucleotidyltransferase [Paenibacillus piri]TDG00323.1 spore coat protein [Paenibacillus piri]